MSSVEPFWSINQKPLLTFMAWRANYWIQGRPSLVLSSVPCCWAFSHANQITNLLNFYLIFASFLLFSDYVHWQSRDYRCSQPCQPISHHSRSPSKCKARSERFVLTRFPCHNWRFPRMSAEAFSWTVPRCLRPSSIYTLVCSIHISWNVTVTGKHRCEADEKKEREGRKKKVPRDLLDAITITVSVIAMFIDLSSGWISDWQPCSWGRTLRIWPEL